MNADSLESSIAAEVSEPEFPASPSITPTYRSPVPIRRRGPIANSGNTCYLSATSQALFHVPEFERFVDSLTNMSETVACLCVQSLQESAEGSTVSNIDSWHPWLLQHGFGRARQCDSNELCVQVLAELGLSERAEWLQPPPWAFTNVQHLQEIHSCSCMLVHLRQRVSELCQLYEGVDVCLGSRTEELDLQAVWQEYSARELVTGHNRVCANCNIDVELVKWSSCQQGPGMLLIKFGRFFGDSSGDGGPSRKVSTPVVIHDGFDFGRASYVVRGVVVHKGDLHGGHYVCWVRNHSNCWSLFDDAVAHSHARIPEEDFAGVVLVTASKTSAKPYDVASRNVVVSQESQQLPSGQQAAVHASQHSENVTDVFEAVVNNAFVEQAQAPDLISKSKVILHQVPIEQNAEASFEFSAVAAEPHAKKAICSKVPALQTSSSAAPLSFGAATVQSQSKALSQPTLPQGQGLDFATLFIQHISALLDALPLSPPDFGAELRRLGCRLDAHDKNVDALASRLCVQELTQRPAKQKRLIEADRDAVFLHSSVADLVRRVSVLEQRLSLTQDQIAALAKVTFSVPSSEPL